MGAWHPFRVCVRARRGHWWLVWVFDTPRWSNDGRCRVEKHRMRPLSVLPYMVKRGARGIDPSYLAELGKRWTEILQVVFGRGGVVGRTGVRWLANQNSCVSGFSGAGLSNRSVCHFGETYWIVKGLLFCVCCGFLVSCSILACACQPEQLSLFPTP